MSRNRFASKPFRFWLNLLARPTDALQVFGEAGKIRGIQAGQRGDKLPISHRSRQVDTSATRRAVEEGFRVVPDVPPRSKAFNYRENHRETACLEAKIVSPHRCPASPLSERTFRFGLRPDVTPDSWRWPRRHRLRGQPSVPDRADIFRGRPRRRGHWRGTSLIP